MIEGDPNGEPPRRPWSRCVVNGEIRYIVAMFRWGVSQELVETSTWQGLLSVDPLKDGRSPARKKQNVKPVPDEFVEAVLPFVSRQIAAMIELQHRTGMRGDEIFQMRTKDIDTSGKVWLYRPQSHKTKHRGHDRVVALGPHAQATLSPWLRTKLDEYLFQPTEAEKERLEAGKQIKKGERLVPRWHPHQLRHNYGTAVRKQFDAEFARVALGHKNLQTTEIHAERDKSVSLMVAERLG